ncbi:MAG: hypothetical protein ACOC2Z_12850, partial [Coleofasciculus sp.]
VDVVTNRETRLLEFTSSFLGAELREQNPMTAMAIEIAATQTFVRLRGLGYNGSRRVGIAHQT